ncbi:MAG: TlpA family protein disulfide reductase [Gaiella sp.]
MRALLVLGTILALAVTATAVAAERPPAPKISGITLEGKRISLAQFKGRPVMLNVWSSW